MKSYRDLEVGSIYKFGVQSRGLLWLYLGFMPSADGCVAHNYFLSMEKYYVDCFSIRELNNDIRRGRIRKILS